MARLPPLTLYTEESVRALYDAMAGCWCHDIIVGHASDGALCGRHVFRKCDARVGPGPYEIQAIAGGQKASAVLPHWSQRPSSLRVLPSPRV